MKTLNQMVIVVALGFTSASPSFGANLIQNGSFEDPAGNWEYVPGGQSKPSNWQTILNGIEIFTNDDLGVGFPYPTTIQNGVKAVDLAPYTYQGGGLRQSFPTQPGVAYDVSFHAATEYNWGKNGTGNVFATTASVVEVFPLVNYSADLVWETKTFSFTATGTTSTLTFLSLDNPYQHVASLDGVSVVPAGGGANLLTNGSFESPAGGYEYLAGGSTAIDGWKTVLNGAEAFSQDDIGLGYPYPTTIGDGVKAVDLAPYTYQGGGISQTFATTPGLTYEVTFMAATQQAWGKGGTGTILALIGEDYGYFPLVNYQSDLVWEEKNLSFVANDTTSTLTFLSMDDPWTQLAAIDEVSVEARTVPVPESSSSGWMAGMALLGASFLRRRRSK